MDDWFIPTLTLLGVATLMAGLSARLGLPTLLGYLAGGLAVGPALGGLVQPGPAIDFLAELGVVLLLFMVGLEFSVGELWATRRRVLIGGGLQTVLTGAAVGAIALALGADGRSAVLLGGAAAMSSTAIAAKQLADQGELASGHGRMAISVLVFQDVAAIPLLALLAASSGGAAAGVLAPVRDILAALALFALLGVSGRPVFQRVLAWVARHGTAEVFVLAALVLVVGAAFGAHALGLSPPIGAFLAGMVLGESDFKHRIEDDIRPFRDVLLSVFFITVGLQIDLAYLLQSPLQVLLWLAILGPLKMLLAWPAARAAGLGADEAVHTALVVGCGGEFGLLLVSGALATGVLPPGIAQPALVATAFSMGLAPLLIRHHRAIAHRLAPRATPPPPLPANPDDSLGSGAPNRVIVCGAGELGRLVARVLSLADVPHTLIESDYEAFRLARDEGFGVRYGDATHLGTLRAAGLARATLVVICFHQVQAATRLARALRQECPQLAVIASSADERDAAALLAIPELRVYPERLAAGLALAEQALLHVGLSAAQADEFIRQMRLALQQRAPAGAVAR